MAILISHRGNINGRHEFHENSEGYIERALEAGYDVEVDVWYNCGEFFLGHDEPYHETSIQFLSDPRLWIHCKNIDALYELHQKSHINCFFHNTDDVTLTSKGFLWTYPGKKLTESSICVLPELDDTFDKHALALKGCCGICSDFIERYK